MAALDKLATHRRIGKRDERAIFAEARTSQH